MMSEKRKDNKGRVLKTGERWEIPVPVCHPRKSKKNCLRTDSRRIEGEGSENFGDAEGWGRLSGISHRCQNIAATLH